MTVNNELLKATRNQTRVKVRQFMVRYVRPINIVQISIKHRIRNGK